MVLDVDKFDKTAFYSMFISAESAQDRMLFSILAFLNLSRQNLNF
jgi:hypothetical protein